MEYAWFLLKETFFDHDIPSLSNMLASIKFSCIEQTNPDIQVNIVFSVVLSVASETVAMSLFHYNWTKVSVRVEHLKAGNLDRFILE